MQITGERWMGGARWMLLTLIALGGGGLASCRSERSPLDRADRGTVAPSTAPTVSDLVIFDDVINRRDDAFVPGMSVVGCFTLTPGRPGRSLALVLSRGDAPPRSLTDRSVVGRADAISQAKPAPCYAIRLLTTPLDPGAYTAWVLLGATPLAQQSLHVLPSGVMTRALAASPSPTAAPTSGQRTPTLAYVSVCDGRIDCGGDDLRLRQDRVIACTRFEGIGDDRPFLFLVTNRPDAPPDAQHGSVVARSAVIDIRRPLPPQCFILPVTAGPLAPGDYWLWARYGDRYLGGALAFTVPR